MTHLHDPLPNGRRCPTCGGTGFEGGSTLRTAASNTKTCQTCGGRGEVQQSDVDWDVCRSCGGSGSIESHEREVIVVNSAQQSKEIADVMRRLDALERELATRYRVSEPKP